VSLSREEIRRFPGGFEDIVRTISTLPGVALVNQGGRNDLLVRRRRPSENLYLVNGLEVPNINHFGNQGTAGGAPQLRQSRLRRRCRFLDRGIRLHLRRQDVLGPLDRDARGALRPGGRQGDHLGHPVRAQPRGPLPGENDGHFLFSARKSYLDLLFRALRPAIHSGLHRFHLAGDYRINERYELSFLGLGALDDVDRDNSTSEDKVVNAGIMGNAQDRWIGGLRLAGLFDGGSSM